MASKWSDIISIPQAAGGEVAAPPLQHTVHGLAGLADAVAQSQLPHHVFCPTRRDLAEGHPARILVRLGRHRNPVILPGTVAWRRRGNHADRTRAGLAVRIDGAARATLAYLLSADADEAILARRKHVRVEVDVPVTWRAQGVAADHTGVLRDICRGGAFLSTPAPSEVPPKLPVIVALSTPGAAGRVDLAGRVIWSGDRREESGFGLQWQARYGGGTSRLRELVRRLTETER